MKIQVSTKDFDNAMKTSSRFASSRAQLPILSNVKLAAGRGKLAIYATNLEISSHVTLGAKVEEKGSIAVPARALGELVANIKDITMGVSSAKESLKIKTESFSGTLAGSNVSDFPEIPESLSKENSVVFNSLSFTKMLSKILFAVSTDEARPALTGALIEESGDRVVVVSSDGFRLSKVEMVSEKGTASAPALSALVPRAILQEVSRLAAGDSISLELKKESGQILFGSGKSVFASRLIQGQFPDYEKIIPTGSSTKIELSKKDMTDALKLVSVYSRDAGNAVRLIVEKSSVRLRAEAASSGEGGADMPAKVEGEEMTINFNYRFLEDFLGSIEGDSVVIKLGGATSPAVFTSPKDPDYLHLIMPVKG